MYKFQRFILVLVVAWFLPTSTSFAFDPAGFWTSSSGSSIKLWANMQQVTVKVTTPQGKVYNYNGWWTRFGDNFSYQTPNGVTTASFNGRNQILVQAANGTRYTWNRGQRPAPKKPKVNISGLWHSSSGTSVQINSQGKQVFITLINPQGKRYQASGRWIKQGYSFDYSIAGYSNIAYCTLINRNQINVVYGDKRTTWYRQ